MDFDLPEHFLPEFPPAMFLTTRPDLGDVSKGQTVTIDNFYELFNGILNPKQLDYTDNLMHDLKVERFFKPRMEGGMMITAQGPIKNFPLRGIKESPPYLHDGRLLTEVGM